MSTVGKNIAKYLKARGLSHKEFAAALGLGKSGPSQVSKWTTGQQSPRSEMLLPIARILGVRVEQILSDEPDEIGAVREILGSLEREGYVSILDGTYRVHLRVEKKVNPKEGK